MAENETSKAGNIQKVSNEQIRSIEIQIDGLTDIKVKADTKSKLNALITQMESNVSNENTSRDLDNLSKAITDQRIKETLSDLSPEKIGRSLQVAEKLINFVTDPKNKMELRSYAGNIMMETFEKNNQRIIIQGDKFVSVDYIDISRSSPALDNNNQILQKDINGLIQTNPLILDTIRSGMLFRAKLTSINKENTGDQVTMEMKVSSKEEVKAYITTLEGKQNLSKAEKTFLMSKDAFRDFENAPSFKEIQRIENAVWKMTQQSGNHIPSAVGEGIGTLGGGIGKIAGAGVKWGLNIITDMFNGATKEGGAMGWLAVLGMLIASVWKFGLWKTLGGIFGIGVVSEAAAGRIDLGKEMGKLSKVGENVTEMAGGVAAGVTGDKSKPEEKKKAEEKQKSSPSQEKANNKVTWDNDFVQAVNEQAEINAKSKNGEIKKKTGKVEDYLNFINSPAFQSQKLENLLYTDNIEASIFSNNNTFGLKGIDVPENLDRQYLKRIVRMYIIGQYKISTPIGWIKEWQKEKEEFLKEKKKEIYKDKTLADLIIELNP